MVVIDHKFSQNNKSEHTAGPSGPGGPSISIPCESESGKIKKLKYILKRRKHAINQNVIL